MSWGSETRSGACRGSLPGMATRWTCACDIFGKGQAVVDRWVVAIRTPRNGDHAAHVGPQRAREAFAGLLSTRILQKIASCPGLLVR
jgi:hypothetical protein